MARKKSFIRICSNNTSYAIRFLYLLFLIWIVLLTLLEGLEENNIYYLIFATVFVSIHFYIEDPLVKSLETIFAFLISIPRNAYRYVTRILTEREDIGSVNKHKINRDNRFFIYSSLKKAEVSRLAHNLVTLSFVGAIGFLLFLLIYQFLTFPTFSEEYFYYRPIVFILFSLSFIFVNYLVKVVYFLILIIYSFLILFLTRNVDGLLFFSWKIIDLTLRLFAKIVQDSYFFLYRIFLRTDRDIFEDSKIKSKFAKDVEQDNSSFYYQRTVGLLKEFQFSKIMAWILSHTEEEFFVYLSDAMDIIIKKHKIRNTDNREVGLELLALIMKSFTPEFLLDLMERYLDEFKSYISRIRK